MDKIIRSISESDVPQIHDVIAASGPFVSPRGQSDYWLYATLFRDTCLCVSVNEKICGVILAFRDQSQKLEDLYIQDLAVLPSCRKLGVGSALLKELLERAEALGIKKIWLTSEPGNIGAVALWRRFGFDNPKADYLENGLWVTKDLKGKSKDRVVFAKNIND